MENKYLRCGIFKNSGMVIQSKGEAALPVAELLLGEPATDLAISLKICGSDPQSNCSRGTDAAHTPLATLAKHMATGPSTPDVSTGDYANRRVRAFSF